MHPITRAALRSPAPLANWRTLGPYLLGFAGVGAYRCAYCGKLDHASVAVFSYATHKQERGHWPRSFILQVDQCLRCCTRKIFGVMKINNSTLSVLRLLFLNRLPMTGMSARNGTFWIES